MAEINPGDIVRVATMPGFTDAAGTLTELSQAIRATTVVDDGTGS